MRQELVHLFSDLVEGRIKFQEVEDWVILNFERTVKGS